MKDIDCPYCGTEQHINHDDGEGYAENVMHQQQCSACEKHFVFTTSITFHYEAAKADCLNGGEHNWKPTLTYPKGFTKMKCEMCDEERKPSEQEMLKILQEER